jgi:hypothetical protein
MVNAWQNDVKQKTAVCDHSATERLHPERQEIHHRIEREGRREKPN